MKQTSRFIAYVGLFCLASSWLVADWPSYPTSPYSRTLLLLTNQAQWQAAVGGGGGSAGTNFSSITTTNGVFFANGWTITPATGNSLLINHPFLATAITLGTNGDYQFSGGNTSRGNGSFEWANGTGILGADGSVNWGFGNGILGADGSINLPNATINTSGRGTFTDIGNMSWISTGGKIAYAQNANGNLALAGTAVTTIDGFFTGANQNGSSITNIPSANIVSTNDFNTSAVVLNTLYTNTARTAVWYLDMALTDAVGGTPALTVTINQGPVTNVFVRSPLVVGVGGTVTNGWAFPLNTGAIYKVQDTSSGTGASVAVKQSVVTKN